MEIKIDDYDSKCQFARLYELNAILYALRINEWNAPPYAPDEYDLPVDEALGEYSKEALAAYTDRELEVFINYGCGAIWESDNDGLLQVICVYENDSLISLLCVDWKDNGRYWSRRWNLDNGGIINE